MLDLSEIIVINCILQLIVSQLCMVKIIVPVADNVATLNYVQCYIIIAIAFKCCDMLCITFHTCISLQISTCFTYVTIHSNACLIVVQ